MKNSVIVFIGALLLLFFGNCKKETKEVTKVVVEKDTVVVTVRDTVLQEIPVDSAAIIFLVRHAETTGGGSNPHLSSIGTSRANRLAFILQNNVLDAVYTTNFFRTEETANIVASKFGLTPELYDPSDLTAFSDQLLQKHKGGKILVVGHSNTTPELINELVATNKYQTFNDTIYDNLFIVNKSNAEAIVTHLKY